MPSDSENKILLTEKRLKELEEYISRSPAFSYVLETDTKTNDRSTLVVTNEEIAKQISALSGEIIYNLRSALDNAYWDIVSPHVESDSDRRNIQFPVCEEPDHLQKTLKRRSAHKVSDRFLNYIRNLKPHGGKDGCRPLYILDRIAAGDRHRELFPVADYRCVTSEMISEQVVSFPRSWAGNIVIDAAAEDFSWNCRVLPNEDIGTLYLFPNIFRRNLSVPVVHFFDFHSVKFSGPVIVTLSKLTAMTRQIVRELYDNM